VIQINIGHHSGNENGVPFAQIPKGLVPQVRWAVTKAVWIAHRVKTANMYYASLPRGRTLTSLIHDKSIWINYDPGTGDDGYTFHNSDLWLGPKPFRIGRWSVLASILHELAHIGGAGGGATGLSCTAFSASCHAAERAVLECGLGKRSERRTGVNDPATPYDPTIIG
jgi:hypothetical protein